jgi:hypothetical protein
VDFNATGQLLIRYSAFVKYLRKNGNTMKQCISYLWTSRKPVIELGRRPCIIFSLSFGTCMKLVRLVRMFLNETYSRVWIDRYLSDMFPIKNVLKQGDALLPLL